VGTDYSQQMTVKDEAHCTRQPLADRQPVLWRCSAARSWLLAAITLLPIYGAYLAHFLGAPHGFTGTGFLQYDQLSYMANARQHFNGSFRLLYGLPFSPNYDTPEIYFQPQTLFLSLILRLTDLDPGLIYAVFGLVSALAFFRIAIALYAEVVGLETLSQFLVLLLFLWGGGVNALVALALRLAGAQDPLSSLDPFEGYWFFNLGRNAFFGVEAYYHGLFLGAILLLVRRSYRGALVLMTVLSASHPFTGLELLAVVFAWTFYERLIRQARVPIWFIIGTAILLILHVGYYLVLLPRLSPEHASLQAQWTLLWTLRIHNIIIDYGPVGLAAVWSLRNRQRIASAFGDRSFGIIICWFIVAFLLANHELLMAPRQPLHFTRGYIWTPLFLIGAPSLLVLVERLLLLPVRIRPAALVMLTGFSLLDNAAWFGLFYVRTLMNLPSTYAQPVLISKSEQEVLHELNAATFDGGVILSEDSMLGYLATVYTPLRAWHSHRLSTPYADERWLELHALFRDGHELNDWRHRKTIAIVKKQSDPEAVPILLSLGYRSAYENSEYLVFIRQPAPVTETTTAPRS
jgi:hypothetical protein